MALIKLKGNVVYGACLDYLETDMFNTSNKEIVEEIQNMAMAVRETAFDYVTIDSSEFVIIKKYLNILP